MRLTFAIPYAGGSREQLRAAIDSVRQQATVQWALTIVDDSPQVSDIEALVASYADPRIAYHRNPGPHGIGSGWNACLRETRSEFLTILHADDELDAAYAIDMLALADAHATGAMYYCNAAIIDDAGKPQFSFRDRVKRLISPRAAETVIQGDRAIALLCIGNFILAPTIMYRRSALAGRTFSTELRFMLDLDFMIETLFAGGAIVGTARRLFRYRRHAAQQTAVLGRDTARMDEEIAFYNALARRLHASGDIALATLARLHLAVRLSGLWVGVADATHGRFGECFAKLRRTFSF